MLLAAVVLMGQGCFEGTPGFTTLPPGGVYRSDDGGLVFRQVGRISGGGSLASITPYEVVVDPFAPDTLYVAGGPAGLLRSEDAGTSWAGVAAPAAVVSGIALHTRNPHILFLAGTAQALPDRSKIWKSFDRGSTWREVYTEPLGSRDVQGTVFRVRRVQRTAVTALAVDPLRPAVLYAASSSGALIASTDSGATWSTRRSFTQGLTGVRPSPVTPDRLFVRLRDGGLGRSDDGGRTAKRLVMSDGSVTAAMVQALAIDPGNETLFAGTERGLFRSLDAGETWEVVPLPVSSRQLVSINAVARAVDGTLWAGSFFTIYASRDGGQSWKVQQFDFQNPLRFIVPSPVNAQRLYAFFLPQ